MKFLRALFTIIFFSCLTVASGNFFEDKCTEFVLKHQTRIEKVLNDTVKRHHAIKDTERYLKEFASKERRSGYWLKARISRCLSRQDQTNDLIMTGVKCCCTKSSASYGHLLLYNNIIIGLFAFCFLFNF